MKLRNFPYLFREGLRNLLVNWLMSLASIGVLTVCLLLISNAVLISMNINEILDQVASGNRIVVYLDANMDPAEAEAFGDKLLALNNVDAVEYTSGAEALEHWKEVFGKENELMFEGIEDNYLEPYYSITLKDISKINETSYQLGEMPGVVEVLQHDTLSNQLINIKNVVTVAMMSIVIILAVVSLFIIVNTIKLVMYSRRKEINIMKYVGGTDWFIRWPFVVEGFLIGVISGVLAFFVQWYIYQFVATGIVEDIRFIELIPFSSLWQPLLAGVCVVGALIGMLGSALSIRKYLRV